MNSRYCNYKQLLWDKTLRGFLHSRDGDLAGLAVPWSADATNWRPLSTGAISETRLLWAVPGVDLRLHFSDSQWSHTGRSAKWIKTTGFGKGQTWAWILSLPVTGFLKAGNESLSVLISEMERRTPWGSQGCWGIREPAGQRNAPNWFFTLGTQIFSNLMVFIHSLPHFVTRPNSMKLKDFT